MQPRDSQRAVPTRLRGPLSTAYLPALVGGATDHLAKRLGARAALDCPIGGRAEGIGEIENALRAAATWLEERGAHYRGLREIRGNDRDVTEGLLSLELDRVRFEVPVAVVSERRLAREVEVRVYHTTRQLLGGATTRPRLVPKAAHTWSERVVRRFIPEPFAMRLPPFVERHLAAIEAGAVDRALACFENDGTVELADATTLGPDVRALRTFFERFVKRTVSAGGEIQRGGFADNGQLCALECTIVGPVAVGGAREQAQLLVYELGPTGLVHSLRFYQDVD